MDNKTTDYQVFARKYRPQKFSHVMGQDVIVLTIQRAIKSGRLGHAYLFAGPHGTGKTSVARLFAKAINCHNYQGEPCNECTSCKEITGGYSLDVLEIDGASHRGIEDIRKLNDTIGYTTSGKYKIYLIDEVHMLTKEAFNALLKSLEEPPTHVKFFFATTEAEQIPATILSRCQRFNFRPIPQEKIVEKLKEIAINQKREIEDEALELLSTLAEGGLRDAESLFDELMAFEENTIKRKSVEELFGLPQKELFSQIDEAAKTSNFQKAFDIVNTLISSGKNLSYFFDGLIKHFRQHFLLSLKGEKGLYSKESLLEILEILSLAETQFKTTFSKKSFFEMLLLKILSVKKSNLSELVNRLEELEQRLEQAPQKKEEPIQKTEKIDKSRNDTLMRFAEKELNGSLQT